METTLVLLTLLYISSKPPKYTDLLIDEKLPNYSSLPSLAENEENEPNGEEKQLTCGKNLTDIV